ncbi:DUF992 domain-containing protein [Rhizobium sp. Root1220]|uniref:DUF992 domain-containing protein n=1 Tax=Rhizobium sp. Root1220 TaxID=1736432 RepID=UPI0006FB2373|nr:DUF992 domain-containing protein [Rhizobium sp. Root1220]KQV83664.1 hypothetical protein ASC90_19875 [Rhizobium sp. Root1220]
MLKLLLFYGSAAAISVAAANVSNAAEHVEVGTLDCDVAAGVGVIIGTQQEARCTFTPSASGHVERYTARINEFGIDIGEVKATKLAWLVYAPTSRDKAALSGTYSGVTADVAVGIGLGANVLIGGLNGTISLQPISVKAEEGVNIAVGVTSLTLQASK